MDTNACALCFEPTRNRKANDQGDIECTRCRDARAYYASLTPDELRAEHESVARYVQESDGL